MKKLVISGSSKLHERALYWRGYFEGRGYEVIDWPCPISTEPETVDEAQTAPGLSLGRWLSPSDNDYAERLTKIYQRFYKNLDQTDAFFLMNEDKDGIEGYIGPSMIAELTYAVIGNLNRGRKVEINILKAPSKEQKCYEEVKFWLDQEWISIYHRPTGKKATVPVKDAPANLATEHTETKPVTSTEEPNPEEPTPTTTKPTVTTPEITPVKRGFFARRNDKNLDITTCKAKCLRNLTPEAREYLKLLSPEFPAWLLKYIAAPEFQRLHGVSMVSVDYTALYSLSGYNSVFQHSIGVALIIWKFTHDKKQTLAGLFHDIASPAFKHCIDFMNGDSETQESIEGQTSQIIRESRTIMRQLKKDGILASEVSDYHLYPIADNDTPNLAADRLEYTLSNCLFVFDLWNLEQVKTFYNDITILTNESQLDELSFQTPEICAEFVKGSLPFFSACKDEKSRISLQFIADIIHSMIIGGYLTIEDLFVMSEREVIDWILSCGDKTLSEAFRQFQRATTVNSGATIKKNCYCTGVKPKTRYIVPLVKTVNKKGDLIPKRITDVDDDIDATIEAYLDEKQPKYVNFDFDFQPYTE